MKLVLCNYANGVYRKAQKLNSKTGKEVALFDKAISYSPRNISRDFYKRHKKILDQPRGNGYWLWKPYFIKRTLEKLKQDDFLFYCDSGAYFIRPITPLIEISLVTGQEILVFELQLKESDWTKRDAFILLDCDRPEYSESKQRLAGFHLWKKTKQTMDFIDEWLHYAQDEGMITDLENQCRQPNYPGFKEHRHDQSLLSLLSKKHRLEAFRDPSQFGNERMHLYPNSDYEQLIQSTRSRQIPIRQKVKRKLRHYIKTGASYFYRRPDKK